MIIKIVIPAKEWACRRKSADEMRTTGAVAALRKVLLGWVLHRETEVVADASVREAVAGSW